MVSTIMESQAELAKKKEQQKIESIVSHGISWNQPLLKWNSIFKRKQNVFVWGENSQGVANAWGHPYVTSLLPASHPKLFNQLFKLLPKSGEL